MLKYCAQPARLLPTMAANGKAQLVVGLAEMSQPRALLGARMNLFAKLFRIVYLWKPQKKDRAFVSVICLCPGAIRPRRRAVVSRAERR